METGKISELVPILCLVHLWEVQQTEDPWSLHQTSPWFEGPSLRQLQNDPDTAFCSSWNTTALFPHPRIHTRTLPHRLLSCPYAEGPSPRNDRAEVGVRKKGRGKHGCDVCIWWGIIPDIKVMWVGAERGRSLVVVYAECVNYDLHALGPNQGLPGISEGCHSLLDCRAK